MVSGVTWDPDWVDGGETRLFIENMILHKWGFLYQCSQNDIMLPNANFLYKFPMVCNTVFGFVNRVRSSGNWGYFFLSEVW